MSGEIVKLTARDGSVVEYEAGEPKSGAMKDVYFSPDRSYVVAFFRKKLSEPASRRLERLVGDIYESIFEGDGGDYWKRVFCWPNKLVEHDGRDGIVMPTYGPEFIFKSGYPKGGEKEGKWWASAKNYNRFIPAEERGTLGGFLRSCLELCRATRRMHSAGLAHSDLSYKNCLIDPTSGRACLIDVDGLVVPGLFPPDVLGTRDFMAPEIVSTSHLPKEDRARVLPSRTTDLHSLAVLTYMYLFHRHPLRGSKVFDEDDKVQEKMQMGEGALFIEHPSDASNRRALASNDSDGLPWVDPSVVPYTCCGPYLKAIFEKAFIDALHTPDLRPGAFDWEDALDKTLDLLLPCSNPKCPTREFAYDGTGRAVCPYCGAPYRNSAPILEYYMSRNGRDYLDAKRKITAYDGKELFLWHIDRTTSNNEKTTDEQRERVAYFSQRGDEWYLHNERAPFLYDMTNQKPIPPGSSVKLTENMRLSVCDEARSLVTQVRFVNTSSRVGLANSSLGLSLEVSDSESSQDHQRVDAVLRKIQNARIPSARVGEPFSFQLSFRDLRVKGKALAFSLLETRGFDAFGLTCRVEKDSLFIEGTPTGEFNGRLDAYVTGRFRYHYLFNNKTRIPGEFKFSNVHLSKVWTIRGSDSSIDARASSDARSDDERDDSGIEATSATTESHEFNN